MTYSAALTASAIAKPYLEMHPVGKVFLGVAVVSGVIEISGAFRSRTEATTRDRGSQIVLRACSIPGVVLLLFAPRVLPAADIRPPLVAAIAGIVIFASGEALRVWAKLTLGRYFTYTVQTSIDQPVITSGPYRFLRHPSYSGVLLIVIGAGAAWGNWLGLGALALLTFVGLSYRINVEEKALLEELGDRYRTFAEHRKRLIPFVW